ncbi:Hpt domain-containing protein [Polaribacter septentrionalilitoris]|jgi:HPt (histidine-containing phosphotransfer) domain-containing protein|uniref:Hpt domain-containing protein n=1 Tax=Polaribacter septentrionalilitoris TaxID=2494657 RepID=UPI001359853B|nr:Hpt domain-containing protein [Polaribacter septentrionalilitoris]
MEQPNLDYVEQLANGEESIRATLIEVIKTEFPEERKDYDESVKNKEFKKIEENVHRLKHKISILGLEKSYKMANDFEHNLREHSTEGIEDFEKILLVISAFLKTI